MIPDFRGEHLGSLADKDVIHFERARAAALPEVQRGAGVFPGMQALEGIDEAVFPDPLHAGEGSPPSCQVGGGRVVFRGIEVA